MMTSFSNMANALRNTPIMGAVISYILITNNKSPDIIDSPNSRPHHQPHMDISADYTPALECQYISVLNPTTLFASLP